jgi:hypothetical protein
MTILSKLKSFFFSKEEEQPEPVQPEVEVIVPQPKGLRVSVCIICKEGIGSEDRTRELSGHTVHKRCCKKVQRDMLAGKSMEDLFK